MNVESLLRPVQAELPAGENVSYEEPYEFLRREVGKLESPSGDSVDWEQVASTGGELLRDRSKDLLIAAYVSAAWYEGQGLKGLATGVQLLAGLLEAYWEAMFPPVKRMRARVNALTWFVERVSGSLASIAVDEEQRASLFLAREAVDRLVAKVRECYVEQAPPMRPLEEALTRLEHSLPPAPAGWVAPSSTPSGEGPKESELERLPEATSAVEVQPEDDAPSSEAEPLAEAWLVPIPGEAPGGRDLRYDEEYGVIREAFERLESLSGGEVDWKQVEGLASRLLRDRSKDLLLACQWARARFALEGLASLERSFLLLAGLHERFWETMHPPVKKLRRRVNALNWFFEAITRELEASGEPKTEDGPLLAGAAKALEKLWKGMGARYENSAPASRPLRDAVARLQLSVPEVPSQPPPSASEAPLPPNPSKEVSSEETTPTQAPEKNEAPVPAAAAEKPSPPPSLTLPDAVAEIPDSPEALTPFLKKSGAALLKAASTLRAAIPASPTAYRLLLQGLFLHLESLPPAPDGKSAIPPLPLEQKKRLELMEANQKWEALLDECCSLLRQHRFDLSLHRRCAESLHALGHEGAATLFEAEVRALWERFAGWNELRANDDSALADPATVRWIEGVQGSPGMASKGQEGLESDQARGNSATEGQPSPAREELLALARSGKLREALDVKWPQVERSASEREAFLLRLETVDLLREGRAEPLAVALTRWLLDEADRLRLQRWEPKLLARTLATWIELCRGRGEDGSGEGMPELERLVALDPRLALS